MDTELYLHIPFCVKKCSYCDFLSFKGDIRLQDAYAQALLAEIRHAQLPADTVVSSVFIGGGTPSLISEEWIVCFLNEIRRDYSLSPDAEITIETNPGTLTEEKLSAYRAAGINRLSIGLQSADDRELTVLGRIHSFEEFADNYRLARKLGFDNINIDLMTALPGQTTESLLNTLRAVVRLHPQHISAYSLIIEPGTPFAENTPQLPDEEEERRMVFETEAYLADWGYRRYEISNYAVPGRECRHNIGYWTGVPYRGLGLGASSLIGKERFSNTTDIKEYLAGSQDPEQIRREREVLSVQAQMEEFMFLGLRMTRGVEEKQFFDRFGKKIDEIYGKIIERYCGMGMIVRESGRLYLTREAMQVSNVIMADFLL